MLLSDSRAGGFQRAIVGARAEGTGVGVGQALHGVHGCGDVENTGVFAEHIGDLGGA